MEEYLFPLKADSTKRGDTRRTARIVFLEHILFDLQVIVLITEH